MTLSASVIWVVAAHPPVAKIDMQKQEVQKSCHGDIENRARLSRGGDGLEDAM